MTWKPDAPQGAESLKIKYEIVPYTRGKVLDLGCGPWKAFPHFISVDTRQEWDALNWKPDINMDCTNLSIFAKGSVDAIFSSHLLEHIEDPQAALREWWRVIRVGGHLVLYLPHKKFYPNTGEPGANPDHKHDFLPKNITDYMRNIGGWNLLVNEERDQENEYSFFQVYRKRNDKEQNLRYLKKKPEKTCAVIRYGGIGDMIQTSSVLPGLKDQGYHITFYTTPNGYEIIRTDPHIDEFVIQDKDQVPNHELPSFWETISKKYDKFINLSESVEGTFLALPGRTAYPWPQEARHKLMNFNYLEFTHLLAGVPFELKPRFYPTLIEKQWAEKQRKALKGHVIMWVLSGSSVHKCWPYLDKIIARLMITYPDLHVVLAGDPLSELLEAGWENEARVIKTCGKWNVRQSLAFAEHADLVVGPETGVLNAVSMSQVPKIIHLSHSSIENLSRDWVNTISLCPEYCDCYPCHQIHYGFDPCTRDKFTGVAACQAGITIEDMWNAIVYFLKEFK